VQKHTFCAICAKMYFLRYLCKKQYFCVMGKKQLLYPILMADIIDSGSKPAKELMSNFKKLVENINKKYAKSILSPLTITLGDEFQGVIIDLVDAYNIIFEIEELVIKTKSKLKLRYVLHIGKIETKLNSSSAYEMLGEGLTLAREKLNELKTSKNRFDILLHGKTKSTEIINNLFFIYQNYVDNWSFTDRPILQEFLQGKTYQEVAKRLKINISSAWRRQKSLNIDEYFTVKQLIFDVNATILV
jgi:hypothetical protein